MTKRDVVSLATKVLGIICMIYAVTSLPGLVMHIASKYVQGFESLRGGYERALLAQVAAAPFLFFIMGFVLLSWGDAIAGRLTRDDDMGPVPNAGEWRRFAFGLSARIIGVVTLVIGISQLVKTLTFLATEKVYYSMAGSSTVTASVGELTVVVVLAAMGAYLATGAKGLVNLLFRDEDTASPVGASEGSGS